MSLGVAPTSASAAVAWYQKVSLNPPLVISTPAERVHPRAGRIHDGRVSSVGRGRRGTTLLQLQTRAGLDLLARLERSEALDVLRPRTGDEAAVGAAASARDSRRRQRSDETQDSDRPPHAPDDTTSDRGPPEGRAAARQTTLMVQTSLRTRTRPCRRRPRCSGCRSHWSLEAGCCSKSASRCRARPTSGPCTRR